MASLRILSEADVRACIDGAAALELARLTLREQAHGRVALSKPSAMSLDATALGGPVFKFKAASVGHLHASGIRLLPRGAGASSDTPDYCAVFSHDGGGLAGLVPDFWLSRLRTAAFGVAVVERLVNPGPLMVALFGAGAIAREIVPLLALALPMAALRVHSRTADSMAAFAASMAPAAGCPIRAEPDARRAVDGADLVITLTESRTPLVARGSLKAGAVVCSMGSHNELDYGVLQDAQRLVVDDADYASEAGDGGAWVRQGHLSREAFAARVDALACDVVAGTRPGRVAAADRVVALVQGLAIGDIAFAAHALQQAGLSQRGTRVELP
ncbi:MAG: hypothetical protein JWQ72_3910 [Polaromonas sp.]|nr:hypothetical protein [Polaromonas sp.]